MTRRDRELDKEIQAHLAMATRDRIARGETPEAAELAVRREFGNQTLIKEVTREMWGWSSLERLWQDVRYALRMMRRAPGFTAVAVLSLALGIGANTAIFSLIDTVMLRLLPVREPGQLVELLAKLPGQDRWNIFSWQAYQHMRDHNQVFSSLIAASNTNYGSFFHVRGEGLEPERVGGEYVVGSFFTVLGVKPAIGRLLGPEDDRMGAASAVAVVSWAYWQGRFNLDPAILGKRIVVEDVPVTVVGVAPREFFGLQVGSRQDLWLPLAMERMIRRPSFTSSPRYWWLKLVGRLRPGVSIEQARAEMAVLYRQTIEDESKTNDDPALRKWTIEVEHAGAGLSRLRDQFARPLLLLMAVVSLLLLIACTNVANMLLARGAARQREMALRVSLGAGRFRLMRQVLTESLLLSMMGGALGVLLAYLGGAALVRIIATTRGPRIELQVRPDVGVLLFTAGVALLTGVLFGLAPALRAWGATPTSSLREAGRAGETRLGRLFGKSLVAAQVAFSVVLLSAASLFVRHLSNLERLDLGFHRDHVLLVTLDPAGSGYNGERLSRAYQELQGRLEAIPGVRSATICGIAPMSGGGAPRAATVEGYQAKPGERRVIWENWVAPKYFETLGTPLLAGRDFNLQDRGGSRVAIVNQTLARHYFAEGSPIGRHVTFDGDDRPSEIVGMVGDAKEGEIRQATLPTIYLNTFQERRMFSHQFALRTNIDSVVVAGEVRRTVRALLTTVPVVNVTTLADQVDASIVPERLIATLSGLFGALGSLLAAIGLYGLLAYTVARRINEIGIRMALGATPGIVTRMVLGDALGMVCAGLVIGAPLAFWGKSFAASLIPDLPVQSAGPIGFGAVAMVAVAVVAAYAPARRAARVDPMEALRYE
jgi:putative ABC transport system permease protein